MAKRTRPTHMPTHIWQFDNWADFITTAQKPSQWKTKDLSSRRKAKEWNGNVTFDEAVSLAINGWPAGRDNMATTLAIVNPTRGVYRATGRDVAGDYPNVPIAVAGDPMCMMVSRRTDIVAHPVVRIDYSMSIVSDVTATSIVNRGAALLSIVDALEGRGYSVELRLILKTISDSYHVHLSIVYKRAGDALDIDRAAFAITHPAVLRRFYLALCEQHPELEQEFQYSYGRVDTSALDDDAICVPPANNYDVVSDQARERMAKLFARFLE